MRHRNRIKKLGKTASHRKAMMSNMMTSLLKWESIITTTQKAKALRSEVEKLITIAKDDSLHSKRRVMKVIKDRDVVKKLFSEIAPRYKERQGGYTRIVKAGLRQGDVAESAIIELVK